MFAQDNLAASVFNILLQCRLYVVQRSEDGYWGCAGIIGVLFSPPLYDKVCFSTSNYMKSHYFHSSHYLNSPHNLQYRH